AVLERERIGHLVAATQEIVSFERVEELSAAVPRLALGLCAADTVELLELLPDGTLEVRTRAGAAIGRPRQSLAKEARAAVDSGAHRVLQNAAPNALRPGATPTRTGGALALVPLRRADRELVLAVERKPNRPGLTERDLEQLTVFCSLAGSAIA